MWRGGDQVNAETLDNMAGTLNCNQGQRGGVLFTAPAEVAPTVAQGAPYSRTGNERVEADALAIAFKAHSHAEAFQHNQVGEVRTGDVTGTLNTNSNPSGRNTPMVHTSMQVRRLTPTECERLQGFPDGYTNIPWRGKDNSPDGPRYKALGNSMAVPVMRWIGERINNHI